MRQALQLRYLTVMPNFSKLVASHSSSKKVTRIFAKWLSGQSAIQFISGQSSLPCPTPHPPSVFSDCFAGVFQRQSRVSLSRTVSLGKGAWADRATSLLALARAVSSLARRRHGCRQRGAGPWGDRRSVHIQ